MNRVIKLIDNQCDRYLIDADCYTLGRQWDNEAEFIVVEKPAVEVEKSSTCEMFVKANGQLVDVIQVYDKPIPITSLLTQYRKITIGFSFYNSDGYVKNSEPKDFYFLEAIKPEAFTPTEPQGKERLNYLLTNGLTDLRWKDGGHNTLELVNADSEVVRELELSGFVQEQADLGETNPQSEKYVQNKSTKYLQNEGADGTSPYVTEKTLEDAFENLSDAFGVPEKTSQLENDGDGTSPFVTLLNTYTKEEVNALISAINSMKKEIVEQLPTENIDDSTIYLVPKTNGSGNDYYDEYLYINGNFEFIGSTQIDLTDYVKKTDYATYTTAGLVRPTNGLTITGANKDAIGIAKATNSQIDAKTDNYSPIVPSSLDYAIKKGLSDNKETWTDEEKQSAIDLLGAVKQVEYSRTQTFADGSDAGAIGRAYMRYRDNTENSIVINCQNVKYTLPCRDAVGNFYVGTPTQTYHCATKGYVDNLVGDVNTLLESILGV